MENATVNNAETEKTTESNSSGFINWIKAHKRDILVGAAATCAAIVGCKIYSSIKEVGYQKGLRANDIVKKAIAEPEIKRVVKDNTPTSKLPEIVTRMITIKNESAYSSEFVTDDEDTFTLKNFGDIGKSVLDDLKDLRDEEISEDTVVRGAYIFVDDPIARIDQVF